jgi:hypothetical protein
MEWLIVLEENWIWICPTLVALYGIARTIVAVTPTPKDDEALNQVSRLLRLIAGLFGLDLKQGRKLTGLIIIAGVALSPGCATIEALSRDPAKQYKLAKIAYSETVIVLIEMKTKGKLDKDETASAGRVIKLGREVLRNWENALIKGEGYPDGAILVSSVVIQLKDFIKAGESK